MVKISAGLLLYKIMDKQLFCFLVHPGGPFFKNKDNGWWTVPKGEPQNEEDLLSTAKREFKEETGYLPSAQMMELSAITQKGGKTVQCWAVQGDLNPDSIICNTFEMEWPPKSGKMNSFPEIDKAGWFALDVAKVKINIAQVPLLDELNKILCGNSCL